MRRNSCLETMAGCASSTRTGGWPSFALAPQTTIPAYASLVRMKWTVVLSHFLPLEVGMPSALRVLAMSRVLFPWRAMSKMRLATASAGGFSSSLGALLRPVLDMDPLVSVGGVGGHPEAPGRRLPHSPRDLLREIFAVKFVHALDDGLKEPAGGGVSACSVMETTRMPRLRNMDLKATACSRFRVKRLNFQTRISLKGASGLAASSSIFRN